MCIQFIFMCIHAVLQKCLCCVCPPLYHFFFADCNKLRRLTCTNFLCGFALVQAYYYYLWRRIPFPYNIGEILALLLSILVGISNAVSIQVRCISLLIFPMYCGTAGRGVLKVVVLTYVVAGPITNMGMNAREVVRVFACTTELSYNMSKDKHITMVEPFRSTALSLNNEMDQLKENLRTLDDIIAPIEYEIENTEEIKMKQKVNDFIDKLFGQFRSKLIEMKFRSRLHRSQVQNQDDREYYFNIYQKKLEYRCEHQLTVAVATCIKAFDGAYQKCAAALPIPNDPLCSSLKLNKVCEILDLIRNNNTCDSSKFIPSGFKEAYIALKRAQEELVRHGQTTKLQYKVTYERDLYDIQDAKETGKRVTHAFEEKITMMGIVAVALNVYVALLFLRIVGAAIFYHDNYLTSIEYDNIYITSYFKTLDERRKRLGAMTLLPLKKMEKIKYIDVNSCMTFKLGERSKFVTQILKVMLEMVTATTFVMLDRLFFEALDVVRQHAQIDGARQNPPDLEIEVRGSGMLASLYRKLLSNMSPRATAYTITTACVPNPQAMSPIYYIKIYGGYLWILVLLYVNPYVLRLRRLICSYFYPRREKQRILHLYNDILKKRMKMDKTLRRKAVQTVRAHYLSGENLLSLRMKFPRALGWLRILPAARMTCLICGQIEPRTDDIDEEQWHSCNVPNCPFVFCGECWREAGARCLACDPSLVELSDMDSLSEDEPPKY